MGAPQLCSHITRRFTPRCSVRDSFMNGTVEGEEVFIPLDQIIGGRERAGFGWNMLMDCLAEGRGISLPAMSVAASKMTSSIVGAYARIRKQFKVNEDFCREREVVLLVPHHRSKQRSLPHGCGMLILLGMYRRDLRLVHLK